MAGYLQKIKVKTAIEKYSPIKMTATHNTTANFGEMGVAKVMDIVPGTRGKARIHTRANMQPLPQPTWGKVRFRNVWFFVPYIQVFKGWNDFIADAEHVNASNGATHINLCPNISNNTIVDWFKTNMSIGTSNDYDLCIQDGTNTPTYWKHNATAGTRKIWKILCQIGMKPIMNERDATKYNAMRLLGLLKIYVEYYYNKNYIGDGQSNQLKNLYVRDNGNTNISSTDFGQIANAFNELFYDTEYFTACWDMPNTPNIQNQQRSYNIPDTSNDIYDSTASDYVGTKVQNQDDQGDWKDPYLNGKENKTNNNHYPFVTQYMLDMLKGLSMFLKRNQIAGGTALQRLIARYGMAPTTEQMNQVKWLGMQEWFMEVNTVESTSDTAASGGEPLGQYAGIGKADDKGEIEFDAGNDYGMLYCINTIQPMITNGAGQDGCIYALTPTDFWIPEFDNMGVETVRPSELQISDNGATDYLGGKSNQKPAEGIFGWLPRYAKFKTMRDTLSGDYTCRKWKNLYEPYTLNRNITDDIIQNIVHSKGFTKQTDINQFNRIFYSQTNTDFDNFNIKHEIEIEAMTPMKPLYDVYDWEHEDGKEIEITNQGPNFN